MKKMTLVLATLLMGLATASASVVQTTDDNGKKSRITKRYRYTQPIMFVERGVEFLVFPNGEFDFNTEIVCNTGVDDTYYYRQNNKRRSSVNTTFGAPGRHVAYNRPGGTLVLHDRFGRVRRIGNVFLNYDSRGRIKRVGSVYMRYRHGQLKQVGGLTIRYNRHGEIIGTHGQVNFNNHGFDYFDQQEDFWFNDPFDHEDDNFYYYRKGDKVEKRKKQTKRG